MSFLGGGLLENKNGYWNKEVCRLLNIAESTLRKWCIELEKNGYIFDRAIKDSRAFTDKDVRALQSFKRLLKDKKKTKPQAAKIIVEQFRREENEGNIPVPMDTNQLPDNIKEFMEEVLDRLKKQEKSIEMLAKKIEGLFDSKD